MPGISFPGIAPGATFTYEFPVRQSGTYWYHSHSGLQEQMGHYGPIAVSYTHLDVYKRQGYTGGMTQTATLYRMVMPQHICPYGLKAKHLLERKGFTVDDHWLETRAQTDAFKAEHNVNTTPQTFIDGRRIGGYDDLRRHFGLAVRDPGATSYTPAVSYTHLDVYKRQAKPSSRAPRPKGHRR